MWFSLIACRVLKILGILGSRANCEMCRDTYFAQNGVTIRFRTIPAPFPFKALCPTLSQSYCTFL